MKRIQATTLIPARMTAPTASLSKCFLTACISPPPSKQPRSGNLLPAKQQLRGASFRAPQAGPLPNFFHSLGGEGGEGDRRLWKDSRRSALRGFFAAHHTFIDCKSIWRPGEVMEVPNRPASPTEVPSKEGGGEEAFTYSPFGFTGQALPLPPSHFLNLLRPTRTSPDVPGHGVDLHVCRLQELLTPPALMSPVPRKNRSSQFISSFRKAPTNRWMITRPEVCWHSGLHLSPGQDMHLIVGWHQQPMEERECGRVDEGCAERGRSTTGFSGTRPQKGKLTFPARHSPDCCHGSSRSP